MSIFSGSFHAEGATSIPSGASPPTTLVPHPRQRQRGQCCSASHQAWFFHQGLGVLMKVWVFLLKSQVSDGSSGYSIRQPHTLMDLTCKICKVPPPNKPNRLPEIFKHSQCSLPLHVLPLASIGHDEILSISC